VIFFGEMKASMILILGALAVIFSSYAYAAADLLPNLVAYPASSLRIADSGGTKTLRFSTTSWNNGAGPVELRAGEIDSASGKQKVYQRIYDDAGGFRDVLAGDFIWHPLHNHFHFEDYALYTLQPINAPGASERTGSKTTFCVMDTTKVDTKLPGAPKRAVYSTCGNVTQGMSVGWGDTYGYYLAGQELDITGLSDGDYRLTIEIDPKNKLVELEDFADNTSTVDIHISGGSVNIIGGKPGRGN
jgi:hypothetical protein